MGAIDLAILLGTCGTALLGAVLLLLVLVDKFWKPIPDAIFATLVGSIVACAITATIGTLALFGFQ
jgi:hypothetical protein